MNDIQHYTYGKINKYPHKYFKHQYIKETTQVRSVILQMLNFGSHKKII